eukprot:21006_4
MFSIACDEDHSGRAWLVKHEASLQRITDILVGVGIVHNAFAVAESVNKLPVISIAVAVVYDTVAVPQITAVLPHKNLACSS